MIEIKTLTNNDFNGMQLVSTVNETTTKISIIVKQ